MHELFPNWYASVALQVDAERLSNRWAAVEALSADLTPSDGVNFVQQSFSLANSEVDEIREAARASDSTYISTNDDLEVRVLAAGVCLRLLMEKGDAGQGVALALLSASFSRNISDPIGHDLITQARQYLQTSAEEARNAPAAFPRFAIKELKDAIAALPVAPDLPTAQSQFASSLAKILDSVSAYSGRVQQSLGWLSKLQAEDSDVAYLIVSDNSVTGKRPYSTLTKVQAAFVAASDLSKVTRFFPLLPTYEAVLPTLCRSAKSSRKSTSIRSAVNELSDGLNNTCGSSGGLIAPVMPLLFAISKFQEVNGQDTWASAFESVSGISGDTAIEASKLAMQLYLEKMLHLLLSEEA